MKRCVVALLVPVALLLPAGAADAKSPPKGKYACYYSTFSGTFAAGILYITSKSTYNVNKKGSGKYTTKGKRINFKSGAYSKGKVYGIWKKETSSISGKTNFEIRIFGKNDDRERFVCETRPR
jgi:hypothetical protein